MFILPLLLACSSVIPDTTSNPVDKLAGYLDVRLGQKVEDIPGLERLPKDDNYEQKEEAYTRPADKDYFMLGSVFFQATEVPTYFVHEGILSAIRIMSKDRVWMDYENGVEVPNPVLSHYDCREMIEALTKMLGTATQIGQDNENYTWEGDLSTIRVSNIELSGGSHYCVFRTQMAKE